MSEYNAIITTPFVKLGIRVDNETLTALHFLSSKITKIKNASDPFTLKVIDQIHAYFDQPTFKFNLPIELNGTDFQKRVWKALQRISVGKTKTYAELAAELNSSPRAIGNACRRNPVPVIIPCHRIVAKNSLGGFNGTTAGEMLAVKQSLLIHEGWKPAI